MFDVFYQGKKPNLFAHEQEAQSIDHAQQLSSTRYFWWVSYLADLKDWNFLWEPAPWEAHQRHAWPSQWQDDAGVYLVPKNWDGMVTHHHSTPTITRLPSIDNWSATAEVVDWDYSWHPDPADPPYAHEFGSQWHDEGGPVYTVPGHTGTKYQTHPRAKFAERHDNRWHTLEDCNWDYSWRPHPKDPPYIYVFGNQWHAAETWPTVEYHVPGAINRKFMTHPRAELLSNSQGWTSLTDCSYTFDYSWRPDPGSPPYRYVFGNQWHRAEIMPTLEWLHPDADELTPTKYMDWPRAELAPSTALWHIPNDVDPNSIDMSWVPDPGSPPYIYQFGTQHQRTGGPEYRMPGATEVKYVDMIRAKTVSKATAIYEIDHMDGNAGNIPGTTKRIRYFDNYRDTLIRLAKSIGHEHEYVWVCSSVCNYSDFDFSWHPEKWQGSMLHVFPSNEQKFGDTFFMHVPTFAERAERKALLEWYDVNFVTDRSVPRWPLTTITHTSDTHVDVIKNQETLAPLTVYSNKPVPVNLPTVSLWREETKTIVPLDAAAASIIVPRAAKSYIKTQLYDYPYIDKTHRNTLTNTSQDIVFISYDEPEADVNWQQLVQRFPRAQRVHGVKGMENALAEAAKISKTPWYFAVFGKTVLAPTFDFEFQPDYMQQPKHYIFYSENRANKLVYGEMAIIMYNCKLILDNHGEEFGLDYTMSFPHEVVPILSTYGNFDTSPYHAWRTAFRETAKLAYFENQQPTVEGRYRLDTWMSRAEGEFAEWVLKGAADGHAFFEESQGDLSVLKQSFSWEWLRNRFESVYGAIN